MSALVTGAGGSLGRAIAVRLSRDGHPVGIIDVDEQAAFQTVEQIHDEGGIAEAIRCDLRDENEIGAAFAAAAGLGPIEVLVNNAAVFPAGPFLDVTPAELDETVAVNLRAYFLCAQHAARSMTQRGEGGSIVNIASITWHGGWAEMAPYVATKGAIVALTRALATELGPVGIRVNAISPGAFPTAAEAAQHDDLEAYEERILESQALPRRGRLEELASAVSFFAGSDASFVTGQTLNVDGGWVMS